MKKILFVTTIFILILPLSVLAMTEDKPKTNNTGEGLKDGTPYKEVILNVTSKGCKEISPSILAAQLKVESGFNPSANNGIAKGIAQFTDQTWETHGVDGDNDGKKDIFNPKDAIQAQDNYMCEIYNSKHDLTKTLEVYNVGYKGNLDAAASYASKIEELAKTFAVTVNNEGNDVHCTDATCTNILNIVNNEIKNPSQNWYDRCEAFAEKVLGTNSHYSTAIDGWNHVINKHTDQNNIPAGVAVYFATSHPAGHVVVSLGNDRFASTDILGNGTVGIVNMKDLTNGRWNLKFLGW